MINIQRSIKKIGIIGAGMTGMQAGYLLKNSGFKIKIFEKSDNIGGVWRSNYFALQTQTPAELMQIPGFPYNEAFLNKEILSRKEYFEYLQMTANKMGILNDIEFNCEVTKIDYKDPNLKSILLVTSKNANGIKAEEFSSLVLAHGRFYKLRSLQYPNIENYQGKIYHSSEVIEEKMVKDKKVVVVGYGKSACDLAGEIAEVSKETNILFREINWSIPYFIGKRIRFDKILLNTKWARFFFDSPEYNSNIQRFWHNELKILKKIFNKLLEKVICRQYNLIKNQIKPSFPLEKQILQQGIYISSEAFFKNVDLGKIKHIQGEIESFQANHIQLKNKEKIECDVVVFAIGFDDNYYIFGENLRNSLNKNEGINVKTFEFYKSIADFRIPNIYIIGFAPAVTSPITYSLQALWVNHFLNGNIVVTPEKYKEYISEMIKKFGLYFKKHALNPDVLPFFLSTPEYHKELLNDLKFINPNQIEKMSNEMKVKEYEEFF